MDTVMSMVMIHTMDYHCRHHRHRQGLHLARPSLENQEEERVVNYWEGGYYLSEIQRERERERNAPPVLFFGWLLFTFERVYTYVFIVRVCVWIIIGRDISLETWDIELCLTIFFLNSTMYIRSKVAYFRITRRRSVQLGHPAKHRDKKRCQWTQFDCNTSLGKLNCKKKDHCMIHGWPRPTSKSSD